MSTGLETWNQSILDIGPAYPFAGTEMLLAIVGIASWIIWHIVQIKSENQTYEEEKRAFSDKKKLKSAMKLTSANPEAHHLEENGML